MSVSFTAMPVARYKTFKQTNTKDLTVYRLETRDIDFLTNYKDKLSSHNDYEYLRNDHPIHHEIIEDALISIIDTLKLNHKMQIDDKSIAYVTVANNKILSIMQGNLPKIDLKTNRIVRSMRNKSHESELDLLSIVPQQSSELPHSAAPALINEFFRYCTKLPQKVKSIYCRSEIPENSEKTVKFYEKIGFKKISNSYEKWIAPSYPITLNNVEEIDRFKYPDDDILPMAISMTRAKKTIKQINDKFEREEIKKPTSVDLNEIVKD